MYVVPVPQTHDIDLFWGKIYYYRQGYGLNRPELCRVRSAKNELHSEGMNAMRLINRPWSFSIRNGTDFLSTVGMIFLLLSSVPVWSQSVINVVDETRQGLSVEITFPEPLFTPFTDSGIDYTEIHMTGLQRETRTGFPDMPYEVITIGVPLAGQVSFSVSAASPRHLRRGIIKPVPGIKSMSEKGMMMAEVDREREYAVVYSTAPEVYQQPAFFPTELVELSNDGYVRQQRVVSFRVNPLRCQPKDQTIEWYEKVTVHITYPRSREVKQDIRDDESFERFFEQSLMNAERARSFRAPRVLPALPDKPVTVFSQPHRNSLLEQSYKIVTQEEGFYKVTGQDFINFGADIGGTDPRTFKMFHLGQEIAVNVNNGGAPELFETTDSIEFFSLPNTSVYSTDAVYWLVTGGSSDGLRITSRYQNPSLPTSPTSFIRTDHFEEHCSIPGGHCWGGTNYNLTMAEDLWFWLIVYATQQYTFTFNLPNRAAAYLGNATVRVQLRGVSQDDNYSPDHRVEVTLNSSSTAVFNWDGAVVYDLEFSRPHSNLLETNNQLVIMAPSLSPQTTLNTFYVNWFEIDYSDKFVSEDDIFEFSLAAGSYNINITNFSNNDVRAYDITAPGQPVFISNTSVGSGPPYTLNFKDIISAKTRYYCVSEAGKKLPVSISYDPRSNLRDPGNSAEYLVLTHDDFYQEAVQLEQHRANQGFLTRVVQLSDVYDEFSYGYVDPQAIKDFLVYAYSNWSVPTLSYVVLLGDASCDHNDYQHLGLRDYVPSSYFLTEAGITTNDHWFSLVHGTDYLSDIHLGRLPVSTAAQAQAIVDKIIAYDSYPVPNDTWNYNVLFLADNSDDGGNFEQASDDIIDNYLPAHFNPAKLYVSQCNPNCRTMFVAAMNSDTESAPLISYFGHGNITFMASEKILRVEDVPSLVNQNRLPFFINMTCYNNNFAYSHLAIECLGEVLTDTANKGAIGIIGSTGWTYLTTNAFFSQKIYESLFSDPDYRAGPALTFGRIKSSLYSCPMEVQNTVLLGDPATSIKLAAVPVPDLSAFGLLVLCLLLSCVLYRRTGSRANS